MVRWWWCSASATGLAGLSAAAGGTLWGHTLAQAKGPIVASANCTVILSLTLATGAATGTVRWCDRFVTGLGTVVSGP
jgi:hypothetical protein